MVIDNTFSVELVEKEIINVEFDEKEVFKVDLKTIDIFPGVKKNLSELNDVSITSLENKYYLLKYNPSLEKWENVTIDIVIDDFLIRNETPTKVNVRKFRTLNNYKSGTLEVYLNGVKEKSIVENTVNTFSFTEDSDTTDTVEVSYIKT